MCDALSSTTSMFPKAKIHLTFSPAGSQEPFLSFIPPVLLRYHGDSAPLGPWLASL